MFLAFKKKQRKNHEIFHGENQFKYVANEDNLMATHLRHKKVDLIIAETKTSPTNCNREQLNHKLAHSR